jgi:hypothetical protein
MSMWFSWVKHTPNPIYFQPRNAVNAARGKREPCAAQGLPHVASVDTTARQPAVGTR